MDLVIPDLHPTACKTAVRGHYRLRSDEPHALDHLRGVDDKKPGILAAVGTECTSSSCTALRT